MDDYLEFMQWMQKYHADELKQGLSGGVSGTTNITGGASGVLGGAAQTAGKIGTGIMNPWLSAGLFGGGALLKALMGDPMEKYRKTGLNAAQKTLNTNPDVINVGGAIGRNRAAMVPQLGRMGEQFNKRFDLDTGMGQYANLQALLEKEGMFNLNASMENDRLKSRRNQGLMGLLAGAR